MIKQLAAELYEMYDCEYDFARDQRYNYLEEPKLNIQEESIADAELILKFLEDRGMLAPLRDTYDFKFNGEKVDILEVKKSEWENEET